MLRKTRGYSLIELLVVVTIMLIVASLAIPRLLRTQQLANEASVANSLRQIAVANTNYHSRFNQGFAGSLKQLGPTSVDCDTVGSDCADLLDTVLSGVVPALDTPVKSGYRFTYYAPNPDPNPSSPNATYAVVATPTLPGNSGVSTFCVDNRGVVLRDNSGAQTTAAATGCASTWPLGGNIGPL